MPRQVKTKVFYIAYRTCESLTSYRNPLQLTQAQTFIAINMTLHIFQLTFCTFLLTNKKIATIDGPAYLVFVATCLLTMIFATLVFNKRTLAKSIKLYKDTSLKSVARLIGLNYLFLNMALFVTLFIIQSKQA